MNDNVKILGIAGSLRSASYNRAALVAAQGLLEEGVTLEVFDLEGLPLFNQDTEAQPTPKVIEFKRKIREADAILISTPEYNYSIPGVLKNAIDCASRPYGDSAWQGKPVAVMGASIGAFGSARAQYHLRQCFVYLDMLPVNHPEVMIPHAGHAFDGEDRLVDDASKALIRELLDNLVRWTRQMRK
jgi:chromate reductase, NAD(P)H dehydrogenase (quinone)